MGCVRLRWLYLILGLSTMCLSCVADPGERVRVENNSDTTVEVYEDGIFVRDMEPGETREFAIIKFRSGRERAIEVRAPDGEILVGRTFTWDEISDEGGITLRVE